jgi:hypothetical protein
MKAGLAPASRRFRRFRGTLDRRRRSSTAGFDLGLAPDDESAQVRDSSSIRGWHIACSRIGS